MKLKRTILTLALFTLCSTALFAQPSFAQPSFAQPSGGGPMLTPEQRIEKRIAHEQKKLGLTDDQVAKLKAILEQNMDKLKADREAMRSAAAGTARQDARKTFMADMKSMREQMKPVLTPEQIKMWKQEKIDRIDRREERLEQRKQQLQK